MWKKIDNSRNSHATLSTIRLQSQSYYWHANRAESDVGILFCPSRSDAVEEATLAKDRTLWGKVRDHMHPVEVQSGTRLGTRDLTSIELLNDVS
jgi:hypothetical protein